jgi:hypothetical protein
MCTLAVRWVASVRGALALIVTIDAGTQHRVFARAGSTHARKTSKIACQSIGDIGVVAAAIHGVAGVDGALIRIAAVDSGTHHRILTNASSTNARKTAEVACHSIGHICVATLTIQGVAGVGGALVLIIAVDAHAEFRDLGAQQRSGAARVVAVEEPVRVVVSAIFAVPGLGSFDASSSRVTSALTATAHADHRYPQTESERRYVPHRL